MDWPCSFGDFLGLTLKCQPMQNISINYNWSADIKLNLNILPD